MCKVLFLTEGLHARFPRELSRHAVVQPDAELHPGDEALPGTTVLHPDDEVLPGAEVMHPDDEVLPRPAVVQHGVRLSHVPAAARAVRP